MGDDERHVAESMGAAGIPVRPRDKPQVTSNRQSRESRQQRRSRERLTLQQSPEVVLVSRALSKTWKVFATVLAIVGTVTGVLGVWPHVDASYHDAPVKRPFAAIFSIKNESPFPLHNMKTYCASPYLVATKDRTVTGLVVTSDTAPVEMGPWQSVDEIPCKIKADDNVVLFADFFLVTCFKSSLWPFTKWNIERFTTEDTGAGLSWFENSAEAGSPPPDLGNDLCTNTHKLTIFSARPNGWFVFKR